MKFVFTLCIVACSFNAKIFSQTNAKAESAVSLETMHIQFDKDIYLPGETIWFKVYLRNTTGISFLSTNLYIGIYNDKGILLQQKQYPVIQGASNGDFEIPDTIKSKAIQVRAFTKTMIDGDDKNFYQNVLTIYQKNNIANRNAILKNKQLQFYVEGGQMVAELENYIGFKASYEDGSPAAISGNIIEADTKKVVDNFVTNKLGIGKIILTPDDEKKYLAVWKDDNGELKQTALPVNHLYGATFHAAIANDKMEYSIVKNKNNDSLSVVHLLFQMNNFEIYKDDITLENEMQLVQGEFLFDKLPSGLMQITLFNKYWQPLQQRLVFVNHNYSKNQPKIT
ncbi:MAG: MG2 domain-containing protein [Ferruginibacter sp.]